jgi:limonene 1,2-monooxygenase
MSMPGQNAKEMIDFINDSGFGAIGTPEMCRAQIDRLWKQSNGGFGAYLMLAHNWANFESTKRSYDLIAREVFPHFQGQHMSTMNAAVRAQKMRPELAEIHAKAVETAQANYAAEKEGRGHVSEPAE